MHESNICLYIFILAKYLHFTKKKLKFNVAEIVFKGELKK